MAHIIKISFAILCCCMVLYSCKPTTTAGLLIGTWRFEKNMGDSTIKEQITFNKDSSAATEIIGRPGGKSYITYQLINNGHFIIIHEGGDMDVTDTSEILQINSDTLKIKPNPNDTIVVVLARVKI